MRGIKAFKLIGNKLYTGGRGGSIDTKWKVGDTKEVSGDPVLCKNGFHFFREKDLCFGINFFEDHPTAFCEIDALGKIVHDNHKYATNKIKILRRIPKKEWQKKIKNKSNAGDFNGGKHNSGDQNSGDYNSGDLNSGDFNSRHYNSGDRNSGSHNSGYCNSGDHNSGGCNSGNYNSGDYNSGDFNSGNGYINCFCTQTRYFLFDIEVKTIRPEILSFDMRWFNLQGKKYKEAWQQCPHDILLKLWYIPEFRKPKNQKKFQEITGINLKKEVEQNV